MLLSSIPAWLPRIWGQSATASYIRTIPATTADPNAASLDLGFPPNTFIDEGAGGIPPDGRDFNGALRLLSQWAQWQAAGGLVPWSSAVGSDAGGYPDGAVVASTVTADLFWKSTVDNNTSNPDAGGANWVPYIQRRATNAEIQAGTLDTGVVSPKGLKDNGFDRVIAQSLIFNGGYRIFQSGYKECWGRETVPGSGTSTITLPYTHIDYIIPTIGSEISPTSGEPCRVGVSPPAINTFVLINNDTADMVVNWRTCGR